MCGCVCVHMIMITHSSMQRQISGRKCKWSVGCRHPCSVSIQRLDANISTIHLQTCSQDCFQQVSPHCAIWGSERNMFHTHTHTHILNITQSHTHDWHFFKIKSFNACTIAGTKSLFFFFFYCLTVFVHLIPFPIKIHINIITVFSLAQWVFPFL